MAPAFRRYGYGDRCTLDLRYSAAKQTGGGWLADRARLSVGSSRLGLPFPRGKEKIGVEAVLPVDLRIPGCPPSPAAMLAGLVSLVESAA